MVFKKQILCVAGAILCFLLAEWVSGMEDIGKLGYIRRNSYGEGQAEYGLWVEGLSEEPLPVQILVEERAYGKEEANAVFDDIMAGIGERIAGDNPGLLTVRTDLDLITWIPEHGVNIRWSSDNPDLLDSFGRIKTQYIPEEGVSCWLTAQLRTGEHQETYELEIRLYPPLMTEGEAMAARLQQELEELDQKGQTEEVFWLPEEFQGKQLHYRNQEDSHNEILLILGVVLAILCYAKDQEAAQKQKKKRDRELMADYADIVFKLLVYIGAGMTVLRTWEQLVLDYEKRLNGGRTSPRAAYEELAFTLRQIQSGVSEGQAYAEFGKRCGLQPYLKLSSLLEQNRKTGTKNLRHLLEAEMAEAWEQQKNMARRAGEEAGTKLLAPLFLMLAVVMVIIMVPAMLSMT